MVTYGCYLCSILMDLRISLDRICGGVVNYLKYDSTIFIQLIIRSRP
ncbi:hypothetical protein SAMN05421690_100240 [Nitrosomonas sp. Nm51]|nr:hypothetical protein SAMN05421690_100240 [Nitrosomonas sp. Nm51]